MLARYRNITFPGGEHYRESDDVSLLVPAEYPNHELWAKPGKAARANAALKAVGSGIELVETADTYEHEPGTGPAVELKRIEAKNTVNGTQGDDMELYADCGRSAGVVMGGSERRAVYALSETELGARHTDVATPDLMKIEIMRTWLEHELKARAASEASGEESEATKKMKAALAAGDARAVERKAIVAETKAWTTKTAKGTRLAWTSRHNAKLKEESDALYAYYRGLAATDRHEAAFALEIDEYARPTVGQGYVMSSGGDRIKGVDTWNFHWGGVVLSSDDNADTVVLENYAVGRWDEQNDLWTFDMYGTQRVKQTFFYRHRATKQHGMTPTAMVVEQRP